MSEIENKKKVETITDPNTDPQNRQRTESERSESNESNPDIHFDPIIQLPLIDLKTNEENETEIIKLRAKLYRYDTSEEEPQFKERGTGEVKLLKHRDMKAVRLLMRRDKTLKLCANHYIMPSMELRNHMGNEKVFIWSTFADLSEETPKAETLAIRFGNIENATKFKEAFEEAKTYIHEVNDLSTDLSQIDINDKENIESKNSESQTDSDTDSENEEKDQKNSSSEKENNCSKNEKSCTEKEKSESQK